MLVGISLAFLMAAFILLDFLRQYLWTGIHIFLIHSKNLLMWSSTVKPIQMFASSDPAWNDLIWLFLSAAPQRCAGWTGGAGWTVEGTRERGRCGGRVKVGESMGTGVEQRERWIL